jgi:hypothetical protein
VRRLPSCRSVSDFLKEVTTVVLAWLQVAEADVLIENAIVEQSVRTGDSVLLDELMFEDG